MKLTNLLALMLLITFASVGAVVFTAGLPEIATYFKISNDVAQYTVTWYLIGYALGQLLYGPIANRYGSKITLKIGSSIAIIGSILCILSYYTHIFAVLVFARCLLALGAACGLKMTFTLVSKTFTHEESARVMSIIMMSFAIAPGLAVYIGSLLVVHYNWTGPFYFMVLYSVIIFFVSGLLPEAYTERDFGALRIDRVITNYGHQLKSTKIVYGGLLIGTGTSIIYAFAAVSPFIAMNQMHLSETAFGAYNIIPSIGVLLGSITANHLGEIWLPEKSAKFGLIVCALGVIMLALMQDFNGSHAFALFLPMVIIYFGFSFVFGNASALALQQSRDKGNASAMMSFINMGSSYVIVTLISVLNIHTATNLTFIYGVLIGLGILFYAKLTK